MVNLDAVLPRLKWNEAGLVPAVIQDERTNDVLMVAWMNADALRLTVETGETHFWSRSRRELWHKGRTSGNTQAVTGIWIDCDADTVLVKVNPAGPACHTGNVSCFFRTLEQFENE
ncbi:MAG TPA: phosphoribosyl-AMP cyclohydrolase [Aggregatilinea sp.]|jgi:phosphoribosyl-ATP pyrophosphohydrolase/phosphoribosyl-AMP cyclohydrolase|nr:phosphoribosyl-AMP cyclohydrolase [Aggregatilinea sp.]HML24550.1 phosphoribosyl-AMP cyclohydrolase [Aggregatilinea sp.]